MTRIIILILLAALCGALSFIFAQQANKEGDGGFGADFIAFLFAGASGTLLVAAGAPALIFWLT
ncbi:MAG: hypothetical protein H8E30_10650 [Alphaproteobacteria bacterium]|nr:hypothetical protein [Alphaproteobacteria bacterium]